MKAYDQEIERVARSILAIPRGKNTVLADVLSDIQEKIDDIVVTDQILRFEEIALELYLDEQRGLL